MVWAAFLLPVMILFCGFVVDVAHWFEHKRHLQTQADAAALAAGGSFMSCPDNAPIETKAEEYGGGTWNPQVSDTQDSVHMLINSATYYGPSGPLDTTVVEEPPCEAGMVDVKLTETDLPWFLGLDVVEFINAHARVTINEVDAFAGALPVAVPDVNPKKIRVWFVDEGTAGQPMLRLADGSPAQTELTRKSYTGGVALWDNSGTDGAGAAQPVDVNIDAAKVGVRVALSGGDSTTCGDELVECYELTGAGLVRIRGYDTGTVPAGSPPRAQDVRLTAGSCNDPYFVQSATQSATTCHIGVRVQLAYSSAPTDVWAGIVGDNKRYALAPDPSAPGWWFANGVIPIDPAAGPVPIQLEYKDSTTCSTGKGCSLGEVHRSFSANANSGPIKAAQIWENLADGSQVFGANSFHKCSATNTACTHELVVKIGVQGTFEDLYNDLAGATTPVTLRFAGGVSGSQNQALDCDPWTESNTDPDIQLPNGTRGFVGEIALGCRPRYAVNQGTICPDSPQDLWGSTNGPADQTSPWECVANETGDFVNKVAKGLNIRILGDANPTSCTAPNNWPDVQPGDPRIVHLFLTEFGAFSGAGQDTVPVTGFASFYITGWKGQGGGNSNPCQDPTMDPPDDPVSESGTMVGHFIKYVGPIEGSSGTNPCDFTNPTPCVAVLTE